MPALGRGKKFSHQRSNLPSAGASIAGFGDQRAQKLEAHQVVTFGMGYPQDTGSQHPRGLGARSERRGRRSRDLEQNPRCRGQGAAYHNERSTRRHIHGGGKFKEILAILPMGPDKHRDREGQTGPPSAFDFAILVGARASFVLGTLTSLVPHLRGQTGHPRVRSGENRSSPASWARKTSNGVAFVAFVRSSFAVHRVARPGALRISYCR